MEGLSPSRYFKLIYYLSTLFPIVEIDSLLNLTKMKYIKLYSMILSLSFLIACNKKDSSISKGSDFDLPIETRSDPGCDICSGIIIEHCCCLVLSLTTGVV